MKDSAKGRRIWVAVCIAGTAGFLLCGLLIARRTKDPGTRIRRLVSAMIEAGETGNTNGLVRAVGTVQALTPEAIEQLLLASERLGPAEQIMAAGLLLKSEHALPVFRRHLSSSAEAVRASCAHALAEHDLQTTGYIEGDVLQTLEALLASPDAHIRARAAWSLAVAGYRTERVVEGLTTGLAMTETESNVADSLRKHYLALLVGITDRDFSTAGLDVDQIQELYTDWLHENRKRLQGPTEQHQGAEVLFSDALHRFSVRLPSTFEKVEGSIVALGCCAMYQDDKGRLVRVSTKVSSKTLGEEVRQAEQERGARVLKDISVGGTPAVVCSTTVRDGHAVELLCRAHGVLFTTVAYTPEDEGDDSELLALLNGFSPQVDQNPGPGGSE